MGSSNGLPPGYIGPNQNQVDQANQQSVQDQRNAVAQNFQIAQNSAKNYNPSAGTGSAVPGMPNYYYDESGNVVKGAPSAQNASNTQKKSAGQAPDWNSAEDQTSQASQQAVNTQTMQNRANTSNPFSTQSWTTDAQGRPVLTQGLAGGLGGAASGLESQAGSALGQQLDPSLFQSVGTGDAARNQAITGAYNQATSRLNPQFAASNEQLQSQLAGQGLDPNSQAYRNAMLTAQQGQNDAYSSAMNGAIAQGTTAGTAALQNNIAAQQNDIANALRQREAPLSELQTLQGFTSQQPSYNAAGMYQVPDYVNAATALGQYNLANSGQAQQLEGDAIGAVGQLAGGAASIASKCDERAKVDILRLPIDAEPGVPYAIFAYREDPAQKYLGVIAQDLEKVAPERVFVGDDGFKRVVGAPFKALWRDDG